MLSLEQFLMILIPFKIINLKWLFQHLNIYKQVQCYIRGIGSFIKTYITHLKHEINSFPSSAN